MPVYKSDNGTWYVLTRYLDWKGERKQKCKRGFETRKEAVEWERTFQQQNAADMDMTFEAFFELYANDIKPRLKENTWLTKEHIVETKIMPYFAKRIISEITTKDVMACRMNCLPTVTKTASHIRRPISRPSTINSAPFLTTLSDTMTFVPTPLPKPEIWAQRNARK